jgi:sarcosine oxidase subunit alpha
MGGMVSGKKDFIGYKLGLREELQRSDRMQMVGFKPVNKADLVDKGHSMAGSHLLDLRDKPTTENDQGWISSSIYSPMLGCYIGLGFIKDGLNRKGEFVRAVDLVRGSDIEVEICSPHFYDPEGGRLRV